MRRRKHDVFELGEEQLLEEPAVELAEPEDPPVPPPAAGSATEASGPEEPRAGTIIRPRPRVPSLGRFSRNRRVTATALVSVGLGAAAIVGTRQALDHEAPITGRAGAPRGAQEHAKAPSRGGSESERATRQSKSEAHDIAEPSTPVASSNQTAGEGMTYASEDEASPVPSYDAGPVAESNDSIPSAEPAGDAPPALVAREFGL